MQGGNDTTVGVGVLAGSLVTIIVILLNSYVGVEPPIGGELSAALTVLVTAVVQWFRPKGAA